MKQKSSCAEWIVLTILPALLLLASTFYLNITALLRLSPYLMLCLSGLLALTGCLLWGGNLCGRMIRRGAFAGMCATVLLLSLWTLFYFFSGLLAAVPRVLYALTIASLLPPLLLPAFLFHTISTALRPAEQQSPRTPFWILLAAGVAGCLLVLTDPLHHLALPVVSGDLTYGAVYYAVFLWFFLGTLGSQVYLLTRRFSRRLIPSILLIAAELALFLCAALGLFDLSLLTLAYAAPLLILGFYSLNLASGLLPDGRSWPALLQHSTFPVQLMDWDGVILYGSSSAMPIAANHKAAILNNRYRISQILDKDTQLSAAVIRGGFALQQRDLRDLHALQDSLQAVSKELEQTLNLLSRENELEAKLQRLTQKNVFFAQQETKIQEKTDRAALLLRCAAAPSPEPGFRRAAVTRANVLVTYIHQLGRLLQEAKGTDQLPVRELITALEASAQAATAAGTRCRVYNVAQGTFPADVILALYDLQESVLEDILSSSLPALEFRLRNEQSGLRLVLNIRETTLEAFSARADHVIAAASAMGGAARITEEDGAVSVFIEFVTGGLRHD